MVAHGHMADLVAQDDVDDLGTARIAGRQQLGPDPRRRVQAARFQRAWHQRQARQQVVARAARHLPQAVVRGKVAIGMAERGQVVAQQLEVQRLLARHAQPLAIEGIGQPGKAPADVQRQVDGIQLDVRQCMQQGGAPQRAGHRALFELRVRHLHGPVGAAGDAGRLVDGLCGTGISGWVQRTCAARLLVGIAAQQQLQRLVSGGAHPRMVCAAARAAGLLIGPCKAAFAPDRSYPTGRRQADPYPVAFAASRPRRRFPPRTHPCASLSRSARSTQ
jgi:hypothetical protein